MYGLDPELSPTELERLPRAVGPVLVEADVHCARCGYNLRGLMSNKRCPECAAPIRNSLRAELLEYAAPEFVRRLHIGALLAQIGAIAMLASLGLIVLVFLMAVSFAATGTAPDAFIVVLDVLMVGAPLVSGATGFVGWWLLTTRDPGAAGTRKDARIRRVLRASVGVAGACWLLSCVPPVARLLMDLKPGVYMPLMTVIACAMLVSTLTMVFSTAPFLKHLGERLEDDRLGRMASAQTWIAVGAGGAVVLMILSILARDAGLAGLLTLASLAGVIGLLGYHAGVMNWARVLLGAAYRGEALPRSKWHQRSARRANDPGYRRP